mmetsp:Transcript_5662/g.24034  ORF Transcript_5662/g.24034 Transcript_5662/m.24034 type:complete len:286 (+) Transcript_5662:1396-2253(+)
MNPPAYNPAVASTTPPSRNASAAAASGNAVQLFVAKPEYGSIAVDSNAPFTMYSEHKSCETLCLTNGAISATARCWSVSLSRSQMEGQLRKLPSAPMYEHCGSGFIALSTPRVAYATAMNCSTRNTSMAPFVHILRNQTVSRSTPKLSHTRSEGCGARAMTSRRAVPSRATKSRTSENDPSSFLASPLFAPGPSVSMDRATASSHAWRPSSVANVTNAATTRHGEFFVFPSVSSVFAFSSFSPIGRCFAISKRNASRFSTSPAFVLNSFSRSRISAETSRANTTS